jgi:hypothetical protein
VLPLSDFGSVTFTRATVNGRPLGDFRPDRIAMAAGRTAKALTTPLSGGEAFTVSWRHK